MRSSFAHSAAWRGALWITLVALVTTGFALTLQYVQTTHLIEKRRHAAVDDETAGLLDRYKSGGIPGLTMAIRHQLDLPRIHEFFYLLVSQDGKAIAGNLTEWPDTIAKTGYHNFETDIDNIRGTSIRRQLEARAVWLEDGSRLLVGDFSDQRQELRKRYIGALALSFIATAVVGLALGWLVSRRGLRFVADVSDVGDKFLSGRLTERIPVRGISDEYDRLAETINRCFAEVERLVGSLRVATDGLAHDLKTPLTRIRARLELAEMQHEVFVEPSITLDECRQDLDQLLSLINEMLALARAESAPTDQFAPVRIDALVTEMLEVYQPVADEKDVRLKVELSPASVLGLAPLLARLIANLLDNAVKYAPISSAITVMVRPSGEKIELIIADQGDGIPASAREMVLDRFYRLDQSRSKPGSGLGLSIVSAVASVHDAELKLGDNNPGLIVEVIFRRKS